MSIKLICVAGARPNFMKIAPLIRELDSDPTFQTILVHTGQHYDAAMSDAFFRDLQLREPDCNLGVGSGSHAQQTAEIIRRFEAVVLEHRPHGVVVVGDVNSTAACALVTKKLGAALVHVEAGLRSFDRDMPEEINRIVTDSISDLLLITEESGRRNLLREGIPESHIIPVGNLMIDSLRAHLERARNCGVLERLSLRPREYGLITLHRPSNVDDAAHLQDLLNALGAISREVPLYFPVHPRTRSRLEHVQQPAGSRIVLLEPLSYLEFLGMMAGARIVLTDSGGVQEETTVLGAPCLTLRDNTERPVTVEQGTNMLAGTSSASILAAWETVRQRPAQECMPPLWDGTAAKRCRQALLDFFGAAAAGRSAGAERN
jgi:UDP-N-acetylglucosamine 2-epimerase (non-hydrolysing)